MWSSIKSWHSGLSKLGKVILWSVTVALGATAISSASSTPRPTPPSPKSPITTQPTPKEFSSTKKTVVETANVAFAKTTITDPKLPKGKTELRIAGVNGVKANTYEVYYTNGKQTDKKLIKEETTTPPIDEVTAIGTYVAPTPKPAPTPQSSCDPNYTPCIPYVAGNTLNCADIHEEVHVIGVDHNKFDADGDGYGCESY